MIEIVSHDRCIACDRCILTCPTDVFDRGDDGVPVIARQEDCQTCFMCEAYCPVDALFVAPHVHPLPDGAPLNDEAHLVATGLLGSYRRQIGWGHGRTPGARLAIGPPLRREGPPPQAGVRPAAPGPATPRTTEPDGPGAITA